MTTTRHRYMKHLTLLHSAQARRGAVAVEFAVIAPILLAILMGLVQLSRVFEAQNLMEIAAREGARMAAMDRDGILQPGQSANLKLVSDVKNFLASNGISPEHVDVYVKSHASPNTDFNLDDPANALALFDVNISVDYSAVSYTPVATGSDYKMNASVTFRNGIATVTN